LVGGIWEAVLVEKYKSFDARLTLGNCSGFSQWLLFTAPVLPFVFNVAMTPLRHKRIMNAAAGGVSLFVIWHRH
jgi:heme exporter protein D